MYVATVPTMRKPKKKKIEGEEDGTEEEEKKVIKTADFRKMFEI